MRLGGISILALLFLRPAAAWADVPPPDKMAVDVLVSGRTSTLRNVQAVRCGDEIPRTFAGDKVKNTPGFAWWVSRHYALKTDYPEDKARFYLGLLEQAYPHYVELFGREIPGIHEKRMAVCYASRLNRLKEAMAGDGASWDSKGGGITLEAYRCAYVYPSGSLHYHQRYILLHECTHLYQLCLNGTMYSVPPWYYEGVADSLASHVYDLPQRRLTVHVLDKATTLNHLDTGLAALAQAGASAETLHDTGGSDRGLAFLLVHFLMDDPDRAQRLHLWRDEMFRQNLYNRCLAASSRLLADLVGPWSKTNADFKAWAGALRNTFHYAQWGWEQDGDTLWTYGPAENGRLSQTDVNLPPKETPAYIPWRMDWPLAEGAASPLVGPVERGTAEPSVGCAIDFSRNPGKGRAGMGLGLVPGTGGDKPDLDAGKGKSGVKVTTISKGGKTAAPAAPPGYLSLLVVEEKELVMDGSAMGIPAVRSVNLPQAVRDAMAAGGHKVGMTVRIAADTLKVTLRAQDSKAKSPAEFQTSWPLTPEQRERLLSKPLTILARDGYHGVTPYCDDRRRPEPDLSVPAPPNRWRNPGDRQLAALYRAAWRLKSKAPASLTALRDALCAAADKEPAAQRAALAAFQKDLPQVIKHVEQCGAAADDVAKALADLKEWLSAAP